MRTAVACVLAFLLLVPLKDTEPGRAQSAYARCWSLFQRGQLARSQQEAERGYREFQISDPPIASRLQLLEAESMLYRGMYDDALTLLAADKLPAGDREDAIELLAIEGVALTRQEQVQLADQRLAQAEAICRGAAYRACGDVLGARGVSAVEKGAYAEAYQFFLATLAFAREDHNRFLEASAAVNLGWTALHVERYDEAVDWSRSAYRSSEDLGAEDLAERASGNLGWAYFELGDDERALGLFLQSQKLAARMGNVREELTRLNDAGYVYQKREDLNHAMEPYNRALALARLNNSKEDIIDTMEVLAHLSIEMGRLNEASAYIDKLVPMVRATASRLDDLDLMLAQGKIAAARRQDAQAEAIFTAVETDPDSQTSMRLGAEHGLARLYERRGEVDSADRMYNTALTTFESARAQIKNEESKLPFLSNATPVYDDYIDLLVNRGKFEEALSIADHSRARTLAQGLGLATPVQPAALDAGRIAQKAGATLLFYWLGRNQSYLWAVTPGRTELFPLPAEGVITPIVERYRNALLGPDDALESLNEDGLALYRMLVAPAAALIRPGSNVVILSDGALSQLNFETLIVPSPHPHYWIEDATLVSAPSLYMLASAKPAAGAARKVLLLGDALSPNPDYPQLPKAAIEMQEIEKHFAAGDEKVFARQLANPQSYFASGPQQYAYIHFVAHGVASLTDPLDSAIILSRANASDDSFKLYAREIIRHPIHARLVTISSCYGGGTRSYAGEGLVGLSWAFLRAGAHSVIGALWEVSDDSTPQLMDNLYQGLEKGVPPSAALRQAKLAMLHGPDSFRSPFFWAPFQIYSGL